MIKQFLYWPLFLIVTFSQIQCSYLSKKGSLLGKWKRDPIPYQVISLQNFLVPHQTLEFLDNFFGDYQGTMIFYFRINYTKEERSLLKPVKISQKNWKSLREKQIFMKGVLDSLEIQFRKPVYLKGPWQFRMKDGVIYQAFPEEEDSNRMNRIVVEFPKPYGLSLKPPQDFISIPLHVNLFQIPGLGKLENWINLKRSDFLGFFGNEERHENYLVYSEYPRVRIEKYLRPKIFEGISKIEKIFGFREGEKIKGVLFLPLEGMAAKVLKSYSYIILVADHMYSENDSNDYHRYSNFYLNEKVNTFSHEALHALDFQMDISGQKILSKWKLKNSILVSNLKEWQLMLLKNEPWFFELIKDRNFFQYHENKWEGHPEDNVEEFFASLFLTLFHSQWEGRVIELSRNEPRFPKIYLNSLNILYSQLISNPKISTEAPIFSTLERAVEKLEKLGPSGPKAVGQETNANNGHPKDDKPN